MVLKYIFCLTCFLIITAWYWANNWMKIFKFLLAEFYTDEHHRARRQANSSNDTSKAKTTTTMIKKVHKLLSEGDRD